MHWQRWCNFSFHLSTLPSRWEDVWVLGLDDGSEILSSPFSGFLESEDIKQMTIKLLVSFILLGVLNQDLTMCFSCHSWKSFSEVNVLFRNDICGVWRPALYCSGLDFIMELNDKNHMYCIDGSYGLVGITKFLWF